MEIREFQISESHLLAEFWNEIDDMIPGTLNSGVSLSESDALDWFNNRRIVKAFAAFKEEKIVGFIDIIESTQNENVIIDWIAVHPSHSGSMLPFLLLKKMCEYIYSSTHYEFIEAKSWPGNHAISLYKRFAMKWVPYSGIKFVNHLPLIVRNPLCIEFFPRIDIKNVIGAYVPSHEIFENIEDWEGEMVYKYSFQRENERLDVYVDPVLHKIKAIQKNGIVTFVKLNNYCDGDKDNNQVLTIQPFCPSQVMRISVTCPQLGLVEDITVDSDKTLYEIEIPTSEVAHNRIDLHVFVEERYRQYELSTCVCIKERKVTNEWNVNQFSVREFVDSIQIEYCDLYMEIEKKGGGVNIREKQVLLISQGSIEVGPPFHPSVLLPNPFEIVNVIPEENGVRIDCRSRFQINKKIGRLIWNIKVTKDMQVSQSFVSEFPSEYEIRTMGLMPIKAERLFYEFDKQIVNGKIMSGEFPISNDIVTESARYTGRWCAVQNGDQWVLIEWNRAERVSFHKFTMPILWARLDERNFQIQYRFFKHASFHEILNHIAKKHKDIINYDMREFTDISSIIHSSGESSILTIKLDTLGKSNKSGSIKYLEKEQVYLFDNLSIDHPVIHTIHLPENNEKKPTRATIEYTVNNLTRNFCVPDILSTKAPPKIEVGFDESIGAIETLYFNQELLCKTIESKKFGEHFPWPGGIHPRMTLSTEPLYNLLVGARFQPVERSISKWVFRSNIHHPIKIDIFLTYEIIGGDTLYCKFKVVNCDKVDQPVRIGMNYTFDNPDQIIIDNDESKKIKVMQRNRHLLTNASSMLVQMQNTRVLIKAFDHNHNSEKVYYETYGGNVHNIGVLYQNYFSDSSSMEITLKMNFDVLQDHW